MTVQRWTDEMLDQLAEKIDKLAEKVDDLTANVDGVRITAQALLQIAAQHQQRLERSEEDLEQIKQRQEEEKEEMKRMQQRQAENDERFNILLEEVRYLIRRNDNPPET